MKTINKPIWHLLLYLFILSLAGSCSDDDMRRNSIGSSLKKTATIRSAPLLCPKRIVKSSIRTGSYTYNSRH